MRYRTLLRGGASVLAAMAAMGAARAEEGVPVQQMDTVTTLATKSAQPYSDVLGSSSVVNGEQIQTMVPSTLDDILRIMPNVEASGGPRSTAEEFNIRGLGNQRIVLRVDGARANFSSGHRGRVFIDPDLLKRVSVLRGPSAIYGSGALGGVLGLEVKDATDFLEPDETFGFRGKLSYNSASREWLRGLTGFAQFGGLGVLGNLNVRKSGDIEAGPPNSDDRRTHVPFSADDIVAGTVKTTYEPWKHHKFSYTAQIYNNDNLIPTAANTDTTTLIAARRTRERRHVVGYRYDNPGSQWFEPVARFYFNQVDITERVIGGASNGRLDTTKFDTLELDLYNTSKFGFWDGRAKNKLTYGLEYYTDDQHGTRDGGPRPQYPDADSSVLGLYIQNELTLWDQIIALGALRWDKVGNRAAGHANFDESELSKTGALGWRPFKWLLIYGKYAEAFRAPDLTELYPEGVHFSLGPGVNNVFIPNPDLKPEKARSYEAGASARARTMAAAFEHDMAALATAVATVKTRPRVLFILSIGPGALLAAGDKTAAGAVIELAGGVNAITGYDHYKPLALEAAIAARPDVVLVTDRTAAALGGPDKVLARTEIAPTPAGRRKRIIVMDALYLLGFGPRTAGAVRDLAQSLHPALALPRLETAPPGTDQ